MTRVEGGYRKGGELRVAQEVLSYSI